MGLVSFTALIGRWKRTILVIIGLYLLSMFYFYGLRNESRSLRFAYQTLHKTSSTAIVVLAHDREEYFEKCLRSILNASAVEQVDLIVSMDYQPAFDGHRRIASGMSNKVILWENAGAPITYTTEQKIALHHKKVFDRLFIDSDYEYVIVVESDLTVSPDFIEYFLSLRHLLEPANASSNSLWCVSAWNDNGMKYMSLDPKKLMRTDFFPGLGWMINRSTWTGRLARVWPARTSTIVTGLMGWISPARTDNYDWWLRETKVLAGKDCIFPQLSRTHHISSYGAHVNGKKHEWYDAMPLSTELRFKVSDNNLKFVGSPKNYENWLRVEKIARSRLVSFHPRMRRPSSPESLLFVFGNDDEYREIAEYFGLFEDFRSSFRGLATFTMGPELGFSNVTLVSQKSRHFWGV